ncbi:MAG: Methionine-tRNA ligase [candidate division CPR2 bacterium GW2011_GWC1_41_48]|uniref:Methionine--tRNA ligase n=1 Tax=candidate division CPR2 bacterium GW2011_GWC1_41_48 TaxID=1618344 RepID=A0A0G0W7Y3_UNCC2|nr:MAG: Methionine-tRNA ligase [candidate division CPR2 bacterium GW2011_GWC2_39_35]KKR28373.1 MAG: Methionine-tRNA ligase [candidate division CPR2 bacterium GW2011_GWD2_39_7]KKR29135.1 MAG: Methionine-tRNA ligase [candidate division CPR2 bacterium GW2011_GWD1_39_7]KKS09089.1 MAG: Methionine-tRNA ligase [candidate division CPR2 bacterium GW2011_GWC1_41_48]OGB62149.1 MAG: methionine--tRNA ligase [candidate division CPR2 bacterium GWD1_39_7]
MKDKFYVTNAIPYVNAKPHIGFALEICQSDSIARHHRLMGDDTFFMMGADENSLKNVQAAEKAGMKTADFVAENTKAFEELNHLLNISNDNFIKTANPNHFKGAQKFWESCCKEDVYKKSYKGLYCIGCEEFKKEEELTQGFCIEHPGVELEVIEEENYFFKLSNYQGQLEEIIATDKVKIIPESRKNEVLSFVRMGLEDFSISRTKERAKGWGVPVPGDPDHVMYVWFDALTNYITGLGYGEDGELFKKYWVENDHKLHVIGKGILRFHAVYWLAMLLSAKVSLPSEIFVHGYITVDSQKISKTLGNVIDPADIVKKYGVDATRYYLLRAIPSTADGDFSYSRFDDIYNSELAGGLGNLVSRVLTMAEKYFNSKVPEVSKDLDSHPLRADENLYTWKDAYKDRSNAFDDYKLNEALNAVNHFIKTANKYIDDTKPWVLAKEGKMDELAWVLYGLLDSVHQLAWMINPFMPETSIKIAKSLKIEGLLRDRPDHKESFTNIKPGIKIEKREMLFPRLENKWEGIHAS